MVRSCREAGRGRVPGSEEDIVAIERVAGVLEDEEEEEEEEEG